MAEDDAPTGVGEEPMSTATTLDDLVDAAHRTSVRLLTFAGAITGLLLGIAALFAGRGDIPEAIALGAIGLAVSGALALAGGFIRRSADTTYALGLEVADRAAHAQHRDLEQAQALGQLRTQIALLQGAIAKLENRTDAAAAPPRVRGTDLPPATHPDTGSITGTILLEELDEMPVAPDHVESD